MQKEIKSIVFLILIVFLFNCQTISVNEVDSVDGGMDVYIAGYCYGENVNEILCY
jgi:hypothetical protein